MCRLPAMSYQAFQETPMRDILRMPEFRSAILLASDALYRELQKYDFDYDLLPDALRFKADNYANRMANRTTPFGAFAGFTPVSFKEHETQIVLQADAFKLHLGRDFRNILSGFDAAAEDPQSVTSVRSNSSIYQTTGDMRFIAFTASESLRTFRIDQIGRDKTIGSILEFCKIARERYELLGFIKRLTGMDPIAANEMLNEMLGLQLLEDTAQPVLTGRNPGQQVSTLNQQAFQEFAQTVLAPGDLARPRFYANLEFSATGGLAPAVMGKVAEAVFALSKLSRDAEDPPALIAFKQAFREKFDRRAVPLMEAIDPELGISYDDLAQAFLDRPLLNGLNFYRETNRENHIAWGPLQRLLLQKWPAGKQQDIILEDADLQLLDGIAKPFSPSMALPFRVAGDLLVAEQGGGSSALSLLARFTPFNKDILHWCRDIAEEESNANPLIDFAEITCITDGRTDNINQRDALRHFEIPIRTGSALPAERQLLLADLYLSLHHDELCLWSRKSERRIMPRLSSAYNFYRSDLPVFRLLCDLQYQSLAHHIGLNPENLLPGLPYYPRVVYKQCVLSAASWIIRAEELQEFYRLAGHAQYEAFFNKAVQWGLPQRFSWSCHDQYLIFDIHDPSGIQNLLIQVKKELEVRLREVFEEGLRDGTVTDIKGNTHANEFIAAVINRNETYTTVISKPKLGTPAVSKRHFLPGSEWLYYKVYCQEFRSNDLLLLAADQLEKMIKRGLLSYWFFIRYNDPKPHLRLRIRLVNAADAGGRVFMALSLCLSRQHRLGWVSHIMLDTYERETERYQLAPVERAEMLFALSSRMVFRIIKRRRKADFPDHYLALKIAYDTALLFFPEPSSRLAFFSGIRDNLFQEFGADRQLKTGLEGKKRTLKKEVEQLLNNNNYYRENRIGKLSAAYLELLSQIKANNVVGLSGLAADLNHMHINRSFSSGMREQELVVYTLLYQYELGQQKRNG